MQLLGYMKIMSSQPRIWLDLNLVTYHLCNWDVLANGVGPQSLMLLVVCTVVTVIIIHCKGIFEIIMRYSCLGSYSIGRDFQNGLFLWIVGMYLLEHAYISEGSPADGRCSETFESNFKLPVPIPVLNSKLNSL